MIEFKNINAGDDGLTVRAKLNSMLLALIDKDEGLNVVWRKIFTLITGFMAVESNITDLSDGLKTQVLRSFDYTDATASDLKTYIDGMNGGISGFAQDTSFMPMFPTEKAATVIGVGAGTYVNLLDVNGNPITIQDADALTVFYKGANSNYWQYKSINARIVIDITEQSKAEIESRITGTSEESNSMTDPFKYLGDFKDYKEFNDALNNLVYNGDIIGKGIGRFRAKVLNQDIEIHNHIISNALKNVRQVVRGALVVRDGALAFDTVYNVLERTSFEGVWGEWSLIVGSTSLKTLEDTIKSLDTKVQQLESKINNIVTSTDIDRIKCVSASQYTELEETETLEDRVCYLIKDK